MKKIFNPWPLAVILIIWGAIIASNYVPGTILTGGDNLHPEFNLVLNIKRSIFAVWQEYQGVGLLGGMGHASDLLRQLFMLPFSWFMPMEMLRYSWTMFTLLIGSAGAYFLILRLLRGDQFQNIQNNKILALSGAAFYLLNIATVQQYFTVFEVFSAHFAALPWLLLTTLNYFQKSSFKNLFILGIVLLLATPAAYVPTLFVVYLMAASLLWLTLSFAGRDPGGWARTKREFMRYVKFITVTVVVNSFWLLPFLYFATTNSQTVTTSKINQLISQVVFLKNKEFGDLLNTAQLKGFWFNNVEPDFNSKYIYMIEPWKKHFDNPFVQALAIGIFGIALIGLISTFWRKVNGQKERVAFAVLFIFAFSMITTATPPFSWLNYVLRSYIPLFSEIFRFPFTKFSLLAALCIAIFIPFGLAEIFRLLRAHSFRSFFIGNLIFLIGFDLCAFLSCSR